jgi:hypothetical protein
VVKMSHFQKNDLKGHFPIDKPRLVCYNVYMMRNEKD